ncbi:MBL fold metallo-hydrolase [Halovenus salina]|uniref:MBL fold metallo-hydrolase n=1 Tax=Halovenus salina TaxID=1510225 RepID=A0ABD5W303_9EURY|nr:lamin tail domain-containing protein [Halovenus salina]
MKLSRSLALILLGVLVISAGCAGLSDPAGEENPTELEQEETPSETEINQEETPSETEINQEETPSEFEANGTLAVHNINVGQSAATVVVGPTGETMLIDTGHFNDDGEHVLSYLQQHDIDRIDYLVATHNDADHIGGNAAVIEYYETEADGVGAVYDSGIAASTNTYEEYLDAVEEHDVQLYRAQEGDSIPLENVDVQVLGPPEGYLSGEDRNENSIVLRFAYGQTSFLYTGDAEEAQEEYLVGEYGPGLNATIYKAGHHGSSSSSSDGLLDAVNPQVAVISSLYDSQYGHPHEEVLQTLAERSITTYWTATHGDVVFVSNGEGVSIRTQREAPTDPLSVFDGDPIEPGTDGEVSEREQIGAGPIKEPTDTTDDTEDNTNTGDDSDGGTGGELAIQTIHADAAGDDRENLNDEYVVFENIGDEALSMGGWTVEDDAGKQYTFPDGFRLEPGATVTLRTGSGTNTETDLYWGAGSPVWNNNGDTVIVRTADGDRVVMEAYS